jgi:hypothetical protein
MTEPRTNPTEPEDTNEPPARTEEVSPNDDELMLTLGSSQDSVTDYDTLLDTVGDDEA